MIDVAAAAFCYLQKYVCLFVFLVVTGDAMNNFINENFLLVLEDVSPESYKALGLIVHQILTRITEKVPYDELFPKGN